MFIKPKDSTSVCSIIHIRANITSSTSKHGHWGRGHNHDFSISTGFDICKIEAVIRIGWLVAINLARFAGWGRWLQCNLMPSWDSGYIITFVLTGSTKLAQPFFRFLAKNQTRSDIFCTQPGTHGLTLVDSLLACFWPHSRRNQVF